MQTDFERAWEDYAEKTRHYWKGKQEQEYTRYAMSSRSRGEAFADWIESFFAFSFEGKRVLDIGSAYAGFTIAAAARGSEAYGIEVLEDLHTLGRAHARGQTGLSKEVNK